MPKLTFIGTQNGKQMAPEIQQMGKNVAKFIADTVCIPTCMLSFLARTDVSEQDKAILARHYQYFEHLRDRIVVALSELLCGRDVTVICNFDKLDAVGVVFDRYKPQTQTQDENRQN